MIRFRPTRQTRLRLADQLEQASDALLDMAIELDAPGPTNKRNMQGVWLDLRSVRRRLDLVEQVLLGKEQG